MEPPDHSPGRRSALKGGAALLQMACGMAAAKDSGTGAAARSSHFPFGPVVPSRPLRHWPVTTHRNTQTDLGALLLGKVSAVQMMFTGCTATCPIQGAIFAAAQDMLQDTLPAAQFISLSIDALGDTPASLAAWLHKSGARPGWLAVLPRPRDVDAIVEQLGKGAPRPQSESDPHLTQVYLIDRNAHLVYRTPSLPKPMQIVAALREVNALARR